MENRGFEHGGKSLALRLLASHAFGVHNARYLKKSFQRFPHIEFSGFSMKFQY
jgi:hypothetical protein